MTGHTKASPPQILLQLIVDGVVVLKTDTSWQAAAGPITYNSLYNGELYDGRIAAGLAGWSTPAFQTTAAAIDGNHGAGGVGGAWWPTTNASSEVNKAKLASQLFPPIRHVQALAPRSSTSPKPNVQVFDFNQNTAGVIRLRLSPGQCAEGTNVTVRYAEVLSHPPYGPDDGTLYTLNLRGAKQTDVYTCAGGGVAEEYTPTFTQHGYRYAEVSGLGYPLSEAQVHTMELHSDVQQHSTVAFSHPLLNAIQHAVVWSQKSNLMSVPTDCPQVR